MTVSYKKFQIFILAITVLSACGEPPKQHNQSGIIYDDSDVMSDISTYDYNKRLMSANHDWNFYSQVKQYCNVEYIKQNGGQSCIRETNNTIYAVETFKSALSLSKKQALEINSFKKQATQLLSEKERIIKDRTDLDNDNSKLKKFAILGAEILIAFGLIQTMILILIKIKKQYSSKLSENNSKLKKIKSELTYEIKSLKEQKIKFDNILNFDEVLEKQKAFNECKKLMDNAKQEQLKIINESKNVLAKAEHKSQEILNVAKANAAEQFHSKELELKEKEHQLNKLQADLRDESEKLKLMSSKIYG